MSRVAPVSTIVSTPRLKIDDVKLYSPSGEEVTVPWDNVRDMIAHHGYTKAPKQAPAPVDEQGEPVDTIKPVAAKAAEPVVSETALEIERLRAAAKAQGIEVDQRWGLKRLRELFPQTPQG